MRYWLLSILLVSLNSVAQQVAKTWVTPAGWTAGLLVYTPPGIDTMTTGHKPAVIIYSHGNGESGSYPSGPIAAANALTGNEIPRLLTGATHFRFQEGGTGQERSFVVISIARKSSESPFQESASNQYVDWSLKYMRDSLADKVDTNKIYLVGISGGGAVGWLYPGASVANAQKINANVLVAPTTETTTWCNIATGGTPIWAFHALNDGTTSPSSTIGAIAAINACGPPIAPILDTPATGGHGIWTTYLDTNYVGSNGMNVYEWMLQYPQPEIFYPAGTLIGVKPGDVFDVSGAQKRVDRLFDGDTSISSNVFQDNLNGFILDQTGGQVVWVVLDSFINYPRAQAYKSIDNGGGGNITFQFFYDYTDTTRHSDVFTASLANGVWKYADSVNSRTYADSSRLVRIVMSGASDKLTEARIYGTILGVAPSIYPAPAALPSDPGKYYQGTNKVQIDSTMNDAVWSVRWNTNTDYVDTITIPPIDGKTLVLNRFSNTSLESSWFPIKRQGIKQHLYLANQRSGHKYPNQTDYSKDIPVGADSTLPSSWEALRNTYYALAAKLGYNPAADFTGYSINSTSPGIGLELIEKIEIGNEYMGRWKGDIGFHRPLVAVVMQSKGYEGAKAADPNIKSIMGAMTGIDTPFLKGMYMEHLLWTQSKEVPWDEIAINEYATNGGGQHAGPTVGISTEQFRTFEKSIGLMAVIQRLFPGKRALLTEFGWDTHTGSGYVVPDISGQTREQTKAYWELRAMEIAAAAKWSAYYHYTALSGGGGDFSTTGFSDVIFCQQRPVDTLPAYMEQFVDGGKWTANNVFITIPNELYWHMVMRARLIKNYKAWPSIIQNGDSTGLWILKYDHVTRSDSALFSIWLGTTVDSTIANYSLSIANVVGAKVSHAEVGDKDGTVTNLTFGAGTVMVPLVDESVQYVQAKILAIRDYFKGSLRRSKFVNLP